MTIKQEALTLALKNLLGVAVINADYKATQLQGGTLGDVRLLTGTAKTAKGADLPYQVVFKTQKKWERPGDPDSWRREYDFYTSRFAADSPGPLHWPKCWHAEINGDEIQLWLEYVSGASGGDLTTELLEQATFALGRLQGHIHTHPELLQDAAFLCDTGFMEREHRQWHTETFSRAFLTSAECWFPEALKRQIADGTLALCPGKSFEYSYLRSALCDLPPHLKQMLTDIDDRREAIFEKIKGLPVVLCHRDFWIENIFVNDGETLLIDWDGVGWGYLGEDIASLMVDETEAKNLAEYFRRLIPAYRRGLSDYMSPAQIDILSIWEMIMLKFGYRILQPYLFAGSDEEKAQPMAMLQSLYELRNAYGNC